MIQRCENPKFDSFYRYGGRGIKICSEWRRDFQTFYDWAMQNGYAKDLSIDRIDNDKGYSPDNCRFTTQQVQNSNKSSNVYFVINGKKQTVDEWAREYGVNRDLVWSRIRKGWDLVTALCEPVGGMSWHHITVNGETHTLSEWARINNINATTIAQRLSYGWTEEDAVTIPVRGKHLGA